MATPHLRTRTNCCSAGVLMVKEWGHKVRTRGERSEIAPEVRSNAFRANVREFRPNVPGSFQRASRARLSTVDDRKLHDRLCHCRRDQRASSAQPIEFGKDSVVCPQGSLNLVGVEVLVPLGLLVFAIGMAQPCGALLAAHMDTGSLPSSDWCEFPPAQVDAVNPIPGYSASRCMSHLRRPTASSYIRSRQLSR